MAAWPSALPGMFSGIVDQAQSALIRSKVDVGPAIVRKRFTATVRNVDFPMAFNAAQRAIFDSFYLTTLDRGLLSFTWDDPVTGATVTYRFRELEAPQFVGSGGGDVQRWETTLLLEILP